ncbi:MAG: DUF1499 domain-containing protein [bacterium]|nr:DUF1499 domain-containing protein [bacterium]
MTNWKELATRRRKPLIVAAIALVVFVLYIDDWGRDFTTNHAEIVVDQARPELLRLVERRPAYELAIGLRWAGERIRNWHYVGTVTDDDTILVSFVRTNRLLRFKDDITMRIEHRGGRSVVSGDSRSRFGFGDLGRNPRNLERLMRELRDVLEGARP